MCANPACDRGKGARSGYTSCKRGYWHITSGLSSRALGARVYRGRLASHIRVHGSVLPGCDLLITFFLPFFYTTLTWKREAGRAQQQNQV